MCKFASFVLTENEAYWDDNSNSHEDIISKYKLRDGAHVNIVRVEISPVDSWADFSSWSYRLDQDRFPAWHDAEKTEQRTRTALRKRFGANPWLKMFKDMDRFLCDLKKIKWFKPDGKPLKKWKLSRRKTWAAAWDAAWAAAGAAAWDAARAAARAAAGDAAGAAAWDAARAAARDAALYANIHIICAGLPIDKKHVDHARDRWRVWQKGYGLMCDVNGVLYVYGVEATS